MKKLGKGNEISIFKVINTIKAILNMAAHLPKGVFGLKVMFQCIQIFWLNYYSISVGFASDEPLSILSVLSQV